MPPERPRRRLRPAVAWVVAAVLAVGVASWGVGLVSRSVTDDRPAPLEAAQIRSRLEQATASTSTTGSTSTTEAPITTTSAPAGPGTTLPGGAPSATTTTSAPPTTAAPAPTTTAAAETRTYPLVGGTVALRFSPSGVTVVFANPAQGFDVEVEPEHGNGVKVEFEGEAHRSRVDGWWDGGPQERVEERPEDD